MDTVEIFSIIFLQLCIAFYAKGDLPQSCPQDLEFNEIPSSHLLHKVKKPIIIAHRGQPKIYQENTKDGILSVLDVKADGFELDIYKTKDNKLVAFHDDDTKRMTGVSKIVYESTYAQLSQLNLTTNITAGENVYQFDKSRKIPLLEDILKETSKHDIIHYLEMKPSDPFRPNQAQLANETGILVAKLVEKLNLFDKAIVVSFDFRKVAAVKRTNSNITVGTLFKQKFSNRPKSSYLEAADIFPDLQQCLRDSPNDTFKLFQFVLNYGLLFKASGSSSFDSDIALYNNPSYSNNTLKTLRQNYGNKVTTGFYTVYSMSKTEEEIVKGEIKLKQLLSEGGGQRIITDDVTRLRKLLGKEKSGGNRLNGNFLLILLATPFFCIAFST